MASGGTITSSMRPGGRVDAEHARHREAPHVGVDRRDPVAALRERDREVGGDRRLADAALARRDREHAGAGVGERVDPGRGLPGLRRVDAPAAGCGRDALEEPASATISSSVMSRRSTSTRSMPGTAPTASMTRRASSARAASPGRGSATATRPRSPVDGDALHHAQLDDRAAQLGLLDPCQGASESSASVGACTGSGGFPLRA